MRGPDGPVARPGALPRPLGHPSLEQGGGGGRIRQGHSVAARGRCRTAGATGAGWGAGAAGPGAAGPVLVQSRSPGAGFPRSAPPSLLTRRRL